MNVLVVGLGNILLQDEGAGVRLVERLEERFEIPDELEVLDGGTSGMQLIHTIAGRDALIVCDAVRSDKPPGSVMRIAGQELPAFFRTRLSPHQLGLSDVLATLTLLEQVPPRVALIGIIPQDLDLGTELSPRIEGAMDEALALLVAEIESLGFRLCPRSAPVAEATRARDTMTVRQA
jgi:hydrogenase maturation protease